MSVTLRCPQCDGVNVGRRNKPLLINLAVFLVLLAFVRMARLASLPSLGLLLFPGVLLSFFCLFVTAAVAIAGRQCCRDCGGHVGAGSAGTAEAADQSFPTGMSALGIIVFFAAIVIGRPLILGLSGVVWWVLLMEALMVFVLWGVLAGLLLIGQAVAYRLLHVWVQGTAAWAVLFLLPALGLGAGGVYWSMQTAAAHRHASRPEVKAAAILKYGRLAPLPESATDIKVYDWSSPFSGEWYLCFRASPEDIDRFLAESPSLQGQSPEVFSRQRTRLLRPLPPKGQYPSVEGPNVYFLPDSIRPEWFRPEIRERGRVYNIPAEHHHNWGEVIVNDEEHLVYIKVIWS